jgi:hypothetical protein
MSDIRRPLKPAMSRRCLFRSNRCGVPGAVVVADPPIGHDAAHTRRRDRSA